MAGGTVDDGNLSIAPAGSATASVGAGLNLIVNSLKLGGALQASGTWGGTGSGAANINPAYFAATTGKLTVGATLVIVTLPGQTFTSGFFFSSRRRHTRYIGDWSSDVCSSD